MVIGTGKFEQLAAALYSGPVKAVDFKTMPGDNPDITREVRADALLASMQRLGIVENGTLRNLEAD
ncbi:MAG: hypothetical protein AB7G24_09180 [Novosphingobium sp.]